MKKCTRVRFLELQYQIIEITQNILCFFVIYKYYFSYILVVKQMKKIIVFLSILILFFSTSSKVSASVNTASSYVLMDMDSNRVLLSKNKDKRMLIASITKIMTAIIAIESNKLDDIVKIDNSILKT